MGEAKALIRWRGESFVRRVVGLAEAAGCAPIVVVAGAVRLPPEELAGAELVTNDLWPEGQMSSLRVGLRALASRPGLSGVLVLTVDRPHVAPATAVALARAHAGAPRAIWQPRFGDRRGHPILYPVDLFAALQGLPPSEGPRAWLRSPGLGARRMSVAVDDPAILENIDTPADLQRLTGA